MARGEHGLVACFSGEEDPLANRLSQRTSLRRFTGLRPCPCSHREGIFRERSLLEFGADRGTECVAQSFESEVDRDALTPRVAAVGLQLLVLEHMAGRTDPGNIAAMVDEILLPLTRPRTYR